MNITIEVKLYFDLATYLPAVAKDSKFSFSLEEGSTIQNLLNKLGLPKDITKVILVNGIKPNSNELQLQNGNVVAIFPPMAGG
jgi:molybdopterin converting factor small subunit